jgi:hypothetical protein
MDLLGSQDAARFLSILGIIALAVLTLSGSSRPRPVAPVDS